MPSLSRKEFVQLCTQAIFGTREQMTVHNQLSGYIKYHREIKENDYLETQVREPLAEAGPYAYMYKYDYLKHVGLGNCSELAQFLLVELGQEIDDKGALARMRIVGSAKYDHVYLELYLKLEGELDFSTWEVDAWDPRIIDISIRPDGSVKNHEYLNYGYTTYTKDTVYTDEIDYCKRYTFFGQVAKPVQGVPERPATPPHRMLKKHDCLYPDYTIEQALEDGAIGLDGNKLHYLQEPSIWQLS